MREFKDRVLSPVDFTLENRENVPIAELKSKKGNIADIGEETLKNFFKVIDSADMIVYAGPVGRYEKGYNQTVRIITRFMGESAKSYTFGGNSADSIDDIGLDRAYELLGGKTITSGGAALAYVAGKELPVLSAFRNSKSK